MMVQESVQLHKAPASLISTCLAVFVVFSSQLFAGTNPNTADRIFQSQFELPVLFAYQFEQNNSARVALVHTPSSTTAGLFIDTSSQPVLHMMFADTLSEIQVGANGLVSEIIEANQRTVFSRYSVSTSSAIVSVVDAAGTVLLAETAFPVNIEALLSLSNTFAQFNSSLSASERVAVDFEYAGLLVANGVCGLVGSTHLFTEQAGIQLPGPLAACEILDPGDMTYATLNPSAEQLARSTDSNGCAPMDTLEQCLPNLLGQLSIAASVGLWSTSDADEFQQRIGQVATVTFDDIPLGTLAPFSSNGVNFLWESLVTIDPPGSNLPYSFWFPDYAGSKPQFLITNRWYVGLNNPFDEGPNVRLPHESNAIGFHFSTMFAGCNEALQYDFYDQDGVIMASYRQQGCTDPAPTPVNFRGVATQQKFAAIAIRADPGASNWILDDLVYQPE